MKEDLGESLQDQVAAERIGLKMLERLNSFPGGSIPQKIRVYSAVNSNANGEFALSMKSVTYFSGYHFPLYCMCKGIDVTKKGSKKKEIEDRMYLLTYAYNEKCYRWVLSEWGDKGFIRVISREVKDVFGEVYPEKKKDSKPEQSSAEPINDNREDHSPKTPSKELDKETDSKLEANTNPEPAAEEKMMVNPVFLASSLWESQKEIVLAGGKTVIAWMPEQKSVVVNFSGTSQINRVICSPSFIGPLPYSEPYPDCAEKEDLEILQKVGKQMVDQNEKSFFLKKFIYSQIQSCKLWWRTKVEFWRSNLVQNRTRVFSKEKSCCLFCKMVRTHRWKSFKQHARIEEKNIYNKYGVLIKRGYHIPYPGCWSLLSQGVRNSSKNLLGIIMMQLSLASRWEFLRRIN